ncbi:zinc ABC transporter substrate-binding protein [Robertmurraya sp. DFI.2.37]|uniref:metal ABC transporter solute-binding protein, Zn/Mn family n=1 Tax=Robertmurraya sp. DFI.2.37 TaxID=3031819 RepID=UPI00124720C7|nr:zinc ABC transporter substrate-binding protein [Robertmurraya sp. DFI.2.37]MDF1507084.1 zinc ABC transporter substrate-binding protein [Robertmurraya sp. DFI.2.37]
MQRNFIIALIFVVSLFFYGCSNAQKNDGTEQTTTLEDETNKLSIYTTLYPLEDFIKKIGGDYVEVESIIPAGADAHSYEPTTKQMTSIAVADAFIYNGLNMEPFAEKIATSLKNENVKFVEAANGVDAIAHEDQHQHEVDEHDHDDDEHSHGTEEHEHEHGEDEHEHGAEEHEHEHDDKHEHSAEEHEHEHGVDEHEHNHDHGGIDPHIWLDPTRAVKLAENIKIALIELNPDAQEYFENNFVALADELTTLDQQFKDLVESKNNPEILVSHAAYGYWEERYGIKQIAVSGLTPANEPSQRELKKIAELAQEKQLKYILFEQNVTSKIAEIVKNEIGATPLYLYTMESISEDERNNGEDYFSLMNKNLSTLEQALQ